MFNSIRARLIGSFLMLITASLIPLGGYFLWYFHDYNIERLTSHLRSQALIVEKIVQDHPLEFTRQALDPQIKELGLIDDLRVTIVDIDGVVIADSSEDPAIMENHSQRPEVADAVQTGAGAAIRYSTTLDQNFLYVAVPITINGQLAGVARASTSLARVDAAFNQIRNVLILAFFITSLFIILLGIHLARRITAPLESVTVIARRMAAGDLEARTHVRSEDEVGVLAHVLNNLAAGLSDKIAEISAEKSKLELVLDNMDNGVMLLDCHGQVFAANRVARTLFSITPQMLGSHNLQIIGNTLFDRQVHETVEQKSARSIDLKTQISGTKRVFQIFLAPVCDADTDTCQVISVFHDITALRELQERQAEFIANASHELMTPLTSIKGFAETLLDGAADEPEQARNFIQIIQEEADRMQRLVQDLLQLAKLDSRDFRTQIALEPIAAGPLIERTIAELRPIYDEKKIKVLMDLTPEPVMVQGNRDWLKQVVVNLLENAVKYTPPDGEIIIHLNIVGPNAVFSIRDSGIGIPASELPLIFERFYRVDRARTRAAGGTGLGLSIVKFIIDTLGGTIDVKSTENIGTTFTVTLPLARSLN